MVGVKKKGAKMLRLNYEEMGSSAQRLNDAGIEIENLITQMDGVINNLPEIWEGEASQSYVEQYQNYRQDLINARQFVETISVQLNTIIQANQDLDSSLAGQLR